MYEEDIDFVLKRYKDLSVPFRESRNQRILRRGKDF